MRIIVDIPDGLGNQLFGYVFGYTLLDMLFKRSWGVSGVLILLFKTAVLRGNCRLINKKEYDYRIISKYAIKENIKCYDEKIDNNSFT